MLGGVAFALMNTFQLWIGYLLELPMRLISQIFLRCIWRSPLRIGTLTFWGPRDFLETCAASVLRLQELDSQLHSQLTTMQKLTFYYSPKYLRQAYFLWIFSISDSWTVWKSDGIIARLVYSAQLATSMPRQVMSKAASDALHSEVSAKTLSWLEAHQFPKPLADCFRETPPNTALEPTPTAP